MRPGSTHLEVGLAPEQLGQVALELLLHVEGAAPEPRNRLQPSCAQHEERREATSCRPGRSTLARTGSSRLTSTAARAAPAPPSAGRARAEARADESAGVRSSIHRRPPVRWLAAGAAAGAGVSEPLASRLKPWKNSWKRADVPLDVAVRRDRASAPRSVGGLRRRRTRPSAS